MPSVVHSQSAKKNAVAPPTGLRGPDRNRWGLETKQAKTRIQTETEKKQVYRQETDWRL